MYAFITGTIEEKDNSKDTSYVVINCGGVGYEIFVSVSTLASLPDVGNVATIFTYLHVREDIFQLFGFATKQEKSLFLELITVSGVGAKTALAILSGITPSQIVMAIATGDVKLLSSVKGLGKKTAERIILELKGTMGDMQGLSITSSDLQTPISTSATDEAVDVLTAMGLSRMEAINLVKQVASPHDSAEDIITNALRHRG